MKKLLFTLAALLMAGGMFAQTENYCYIKNFEVAQDELGTEIEVPVAVHADQYFSGWQVTVLMPEGMEITDYESGEDNKGIPYLNKTGKSKTTDGSCGANDAYNMFLGAIQEAGYTQVDGVWTSYGAVCWAPDEYEEIVLLTVKIAEDFKGGEITVKSKLSNTPSELFTETFGPSATGVEFTKTTTVTVEGGQEEPKYIAGEVTLGDLNEGFDVPVTIAMEDPTEGYVVAVTVNGAEAAIEDGVIVLPNEADTYTVAVVITADGYEGTVEATREYTIEQAAEPQITIEETSEYMTITAKPATSLVVAGYETFTDEDGSLYVVVPRPEAETGTTVTYTATNTEEGKLPNTVSAEATATPKAKTASNAPEFSITDMDADYVYITATGTGTVTMLDGPEGNAIDNPVKVARPAYGEENGSYTAYATNLDEGWYVPTEGNRTFEIPAKDPKNYEIAEPTVTVTPGDDAYTISAAVEGEGNVTLWVTTYDAETGVPTKTAYTNPAEVVIPRTDADQEISYYATAELTEAPEGYDTWTNNASEAVQTVIPAKPVVEPETLEGEIEFGPVNQENGQFTVTYTGSEEDVTITLDDETILPVRSTTNTFKLPDYGTYPVTATASKAGYKDVTGEATLVWEKPAPKELEGEVFVSVDENGNITAQYAPAEGEPTEGYTITTDPTKLTDYGTNIPVTVTVEHEGYEPLEVEKTVDYNAPVTGQTAAPGDDLQNKVVKFGDVYYNTYELTLIETEPSTIYYRVGTLNPETGLFEYTDWMTYEDMLTYTTPGTYMVEAYAVADGKTPSKTIQVGFTVSEATSIEELFADKNIASVRYFNMAGQEMQEANGICVTVYTFTDGTQTAIKVMK